MTEEKRGRGRPKKEIVIEKKELKQKTRTHREPVGQPFKVTDEDKRKAEMFSGIGLPHKQIASLLDNENGIALDTLYKYFKKELDAGAAKYNAKVCREFYTNKVLGGDTVAQIFWLKTRCGFVDLSRHQLVGKDDGPIEVKAVNSEVLDLIKKAHEVE